MRKIIRLGDPTTHGGKVILAASNTTAMGVAIARKGDRCLCPIPGHQNYFGAESEATVRIDGVSVAF